MLAKTAKIMVVDDMKMIRSSMKRYLEKLGYNNIVFAEDGVQAAEQHWKERPEFIFMDVVMPNSTGVEALQVIREADKKTPIVMLTSVAEESVMSKCEALGISGYILKPLTMETGPDVLAEFLAKV
jgi:two-component system, response regulator PdtaR